MYDGWRASPGSHQQAPLGLAQNRKASRNT